MFVDEYFDTSKMQFILANMDELPSALKFLKHAAENIQVKSVDHWQHWHQPKEEHISWIRSGFENKEFYFVHWDEKRIGMFRIMESDEKYWGNQSEYARYLHSLVILRSFSGKGMGKTMIKKIIEEAKLQNVNLIRLDCTANNERLCRYYEDLGFKLVRTKQMSHSKNNLYELII